MGIEIERTDDADAHQMAAERVLDVKDSEANGFVLFTFDMDAGATTVMSNLPPDKIATVVAIVHKANEEEATKAKARTLGADTLH